MIGEHNTFWEYLAFGFLALAAGILSLIIEYPIQCALLFLIGVIIAFIIYNRRKLCR